MHFRDRIQIDITIDSGETEEILVLTPAAAGPFEDLCCQFVFSFFQIRSQFEFGWCKGIFTVSYKVTVQPYSDTTFCTLERDKYFFTCHLFRNFKIFHIRSNRIESLRNLTRFYFFSSFPWILYICILRYIISLHLDMSRYTDIIPWSTAVFRFFKSGNGTVIVFCIVEFPQSIQAVTEVIHLLFHRFHRSVISVV